MKWDWLWGGEMWAPPDLNRKPEYHTLWEDIQELGRLAVKGVGWTLVTLLGLVLMWPILAAFYWLVGDGDKVLDGFMMVGYPWVFALIAVAWAYSAVIGPLRSVPIWAWLIIIPLFGIWRHIAAINRRAEEAKEPPSDAPPR